MSWPSYVQPGQDIVAQQYNALVDALALWGGQVDAGGYSIKNLAGVTLAANATLDISAGGFKVTGDWSTTGKLSVNYSGADGIGLSVATPGGPVLNVVTGAGVTNPQLRSSTGSVVVACADGSRTIRLNATAGQQEAITTTTGRLTVGAGIDCTADITAVSIVTSGKITAGSLQITGTVSAGALTVSSLTATGDVSVGGSLQTGRADGYLYVAPSLRASQTIMGSAGIYAAASADWTKYVGLYWGGDANGHLVCTSGITVVDANLTVSGWLRTTGASGFYVYSPDLSRYMQIICANSGNPTIGSTTGTLSISNAMAVAGNFSAGPQLSVVCPTAAGNGLVCYSNDQSRYLQMYCVNGGTPTIVSSTGALAINGSNLQVLGAAIYCYSPDQTRYLSIVTPNNSYPTFGTNVTGCSFSFSLPAGASNYVNFSHPSAQFNLGVANNVVAGSSTYCPYVYSSTGAFYFSGTAVGIIAAGGLACYSPDCTRYGQFATANSGNPTLNSSTNVLAIACGVTIAAGGLTITAGGLTCSAGNIDAWAGNIRVLQGNPFCWYNSGNTIYGVLGWDGSYPALNVSSGWFSVLCPMLCRSTIQSNVASASGTAPIGFQLIAPNMANTTINIGINSTVNGSNQPYIQSNTATLNIWDNLVYVTGAVSATAHQTHASGQALSDLVRAFQRTEDEPNEFGELTEHVVPNNSWNFVLHDDGVHLLAKRENGEIWDMLFPWSAARKVGA
jgi:hypothetical protein